ncbi:MAG: hypothetical protein MPJ24_09760 [Pirellulaceae bacterium]|nr:hypothetical protein [Pirellulaceae bacterium]
MKYKLLLMILATLVYLPKGYAQEYTYEFTEAFFSEDRNTLVRVDLLNNRSTEPGKNTLLFIHRYQEETKSFKRVSVPFFPDGHPPFRPSKCFISNDSRYLVLLEGGDSPRAVSIYDLVSKEKRFFALPDFLPEEMITCAEGEDGQRYGDKYPKVRTRRHSIFHHIHEWIGKCRWDEENLCLYTNYGGHPFEQHSKFNPPNVKIDVAKMEVTLLPDDDEKLRMVEQPNEEDLVGYFYEDLHGSLFDVVFSSYDLFARVERPDWPQKQDGVATAYIYHYQEETKEYAKIKTLKLPYTSLPFRYILHGWTYFVVLGDGSDPRALSIYNIKTGKEKHFALEDFLPEEMIAGKLLRDGSHTYYGSDYPKIRTQYTFGFHPRHRWTGRVSYYNNKEGDLCYTPSYRLGGYKPPNVEINLIKMTVTLLGYDEEESKK